MVPHPPLDLEPLPPRFAPAVRTARHHRGLRQWELADLLTAAGHRTQVHLVSAWENGHREPSVQETYALEDALHLPEGTLHLRLRGRTPDARDLYARFSPESLYYVTPVVLEHVHVGRSVAVERVEVTRRLHALRPMSTCFLAHAEDDPERRVRVEARSGCTVGNRRPLMKGRVELRLELETPMRAGEERTIRYTVRHHGSGRPADRWHRHNGTAMHRLIQIAVSLPEPGGRVTWTTHPHDGTGPARQQTQVLRGLAGNWCWRYPGEVGCQVSWEPRA